MFTDTNAKLGRHVGSLGGEKKSEENSGKCRSLPLRLKVYRRCQACDAGQHPGTVEISRLPARKFTCQEVLVHGGAVCHARLGQGGYCIFTVVCSRGRSTTP
ncbi:hypothetical protein LY76DRAFT_1815 [Colletotrichum caudatum]|nr:hypothetical protein LY76DRAFT_1815 [Colletotrichum caudatum]